MENPLKQMFCDGDESVSLVETLSTELGIILPQNKQIIERFPHVWFYGLSL